MPRFRRPRRTTVRRKRRTYKRYPKASTAILARRPEVKYHLFNETTNVSSTGAMFSLFDLDHGTTGQQLIGNKAILKNIEFRFTLRRAAASTPAVVRLILFRYLEDNGGGPTVGNILQDEGANNDYIIQPKKRDLAEDSRFIYDKTISLVGPFSAGTDETSDYQINRVWRFRNISKGIPYKKNSGGTAERGGFYLFIVASDTVAFNARAITFYTDA